MEAAAHLLPALPYQMLGLQEHATTPVSHAWSWGSELGGSLRSRDFLDLTISPNGSEAILDTRQVLSAGDCEQHAFFLVRLLYAC